MRNTIWEHLNTSICNQNTNSPKLFATYLKSRFCVQSFPVVCVGVVRRSAPSDLAPPTLPLGNTHCTVHCTPTAQCTAHPLHHCTVQTGRTWCLEISQENPKSILGGKSQLQKKTSILNFYTTLQVSNFKITFL